MILYHGGTEAVMHPDCKMGRPDLDFGQGFYVTRLQDQAEGFARRKARAEKLLPPGTEDPESRFKSFQQFHRLAAPVKQIPDTESDRKSVV